MKGVDVSIFLRNYFSGGRFRKGGEFSKEKQNASRSIFLRRTFRHLRLGKTRDEEIRGTPASDYGRRRFYVPGKTNKNLWRRKCVRRAIYRTEE